jgi:hypothetical protein
MLEPTMRDPVLSLLSKSELAIFDRLATRHARCANELATVVTEMMDASRRRDYGSFTKAKHNVERAKRDCTEAQTALRILKEEFGRRQAESQGILSPVRSFLGVTADLD